MHTAFGVRALPQVLKTFLAASGRPVKEALIRDVVDASLFAGVLGTTDMTSKCVKDTKGRRLAF